MHPRPPRTPKNIGEVLRNGVYRDPTAVDEALVQQIFDPSCDPGAREVFVSVVTGELTSLACDVAGHSDSSGGCEGGT